MVQPNKSLFLTHVTIQSMQVRELSNMPFSKEQGATYRWQFYHLIMTHYETQRVADSAGLGGYCQA